MPPIILIVATYAGCSSYNSYNWAGGLPKDLRTGRALAKEIPWISPPGGSCGGAIFTLTKKTQKQISKEGLQYFSDKTVTRRWKKSSISWSVGGSDGRTRISFDCVVRSSGKEKHYREKIRKALRSKNAYYGVIGKSKDRILVLPNEKLVFIGYWD